MDRHMENFARSASDGTPRGIHNEYAHLRKEVHTRPNAANDA